MKKSHLQVVIAGLSALAHPMLSQHVNLAKIALGMDEAEVKTALASTHRSTSNNLQPFLISTISSQELRQSPSPSS